MEEKENGLTLAELGHLLREERIRRGLSVEAIADQLKITSRVVRAIEDGDVDGMPHAVYARGFIRCYANLLGIDEELVQGGCVALRESEEVPAVPTPLDFSPPMRRSFRIPWFTAILCVIFVLGGIWYFRDRLPLGPLSSIGKATEQVAQPAASLEPDAPAQVEEPQQTPADGNVGEAPATGPEETPPAALEATETVSVPEVADSTTEREPVDDSHHVVISAVATCWIHTTVDGTESMQRTLRKGESVTLTFSENLVLKLGNAGGVQIVYDGRELESFGKTGQVRTIAFPKDAQN